MSDSRQNAEASPQEAKASPQNAETSPQEAKAELRAGFLAARRASPRGATDHASVREALLDLARGRDTVAGYLPLRTEPGGAELPESLAACCTRLIVPILLPDQDLDWSVYGTNRPLGVSAIGSAELVIVPAVAVDRSGVRLGRGGGSYDRALARVPVGTLVVAVVYQHEVIDSLPAEPHDRRVNAVVTPAGLIRL